MAIRRVLCMGIAAALAMGAAASSSSGSPVVDPRPNILLIITDDQRADGTMTVMPKTRRWFKRNGVAFTNGYATTPTCCPSRASMFTGRYAHNHGVTTSEKRAVANLDHSTTVQRHLKGAGYMTGLVGKFLNAWSLEEPPPYFDRWALFSDRSYFGYRDGRWNIDGRVRRVARYSTDFIRAKSLEFLDAAESQDQRPWFLVVTPFAPHKPATPAPRFRRARVPPLRSSPAMEEADRTDKPAFVQNELVDSRRIQRFRKKQLRALMSVDRMVESLSSRLVEHGEKRHTLAFFVSDNGFMWGEHGVKGKRFPYAASTKIPMFMSWPERIRGGGREDKLVGNIDLAPSIYEAAGVEPTYTLDGRSLLSSDARDRLLLEHWLREDRNEPSWGSLITPSMQYTEHYDVTDRYLVSFREYYDLQNDPWQLDNLLHDGDGSNDPSYTGLSLQLLDDQDCRGTSGAGACP